GGGRALVLAHRDELIGQAVDKLQEVMPERRADIGIVKAQWDETDATIVVASVQTLARRRRLQRLRPDFSVVVVDEAHHALAASYTRVLEYLGCALPYRALPLEDDAPLLLGVTATPERGDRKSLATIFERVVYRYELLRAIEDGHLSDVRAVQVRLDVDLGQVPQRNGDYQDGALADALTSAHGPEHVL